MLTAKMVKECALAGGADLCGIAGVSRFKDGPPETHPLSLFPEAKSVIVYASRILKGSYKGIQEGTDWSTYWIYGYGSGIYGALGSATGAIAALLDEHGYEAVQSPGGHTLLDEAPPARPPLAKGKLPPCIMLHMRVSAALAGLGEFGWSKVFLTPEFGPRQRFEILLTDAELEPDPLLPEPICDSCQECVRQCPGHALGGPRQAITVEGREFAWGTVDCGKCKVTHWGLNPAASPFVRKDLPGMNMEVEKTSYDWYAAYRLGFALSERISYLKLIANGSAEHGQGGRPGSVCGAVGCVQACNTHLEKRAKLRGGTKATPAPTVARDTLKRWTTSLGLDLVGVASVDHYRTVAPQHNPLSILPTAKSVVVFGKSIPRSYFRGIEEGTLWMRVDRYLPPRPGYVLCRLFEDSGWLAVPSSPLAPERWPDGVAAAEGKPAPNVTPDIQVAAQLAGLGEIAFNGSFLTPQFGVRQSLGMLFTDAEIEPDQPFASGRLCAREACLACVKGCPAKALSATPVTRQAGDQAVQVGTFCQETCQFCANGAFPDTSLASAPPNRLAAACTRACLAHLEDDGVITTGYKARFRRREPWGVGTFEW